MTAATNPSRPQRPCTTCGRSFAVPANNPGKRYCTPRCRVADWHHRHDRADGRRPAAPRPVADGARNGVLDAVPANNGVPNVVALCPHCDEPVAIPDLLEAAETPAELEVITMPDR